MTPMTERDKKLLGFLAVVVVLFVFVWLLILPQAERYFDLDTELAMAEQSQYEMDLKMVSLQGEQKRNEELKEKRAEAAMQYYPMLDTQEIDAEVTSFLLEHGLMVENLAIAAAELSDLEPYAASGMAAAQRAHEAGTETQTENGTSSEAEGLLQTEDSALAGTEASMRTENGALSEVEASMRTEDDALAETQAGGTALHETDADAPAYIYADQVVQNQVYAADVTAKCSGTKEQVMELIDFLTDENPAVFVTGYSFETPASEDGAKTTVTIGLQLLMCGGEAAGLE